MVKHININNNQFDRKRTTAQAAHTTQILENEDNDGKKNEIINR